MNGTIPTAPTGPPGRLPLAGIRVLDYAQYVAGPFATMLLADLGADVVKVEPPNGDAWRRYEPINADTSTWFVALNRNKRSVVADLKTDEGRARSRALIATADVVVHNMPPERAERFGLDRESVRAANEAAVWCCVSAFGTQGPDTGVLGYDLIAQAASGLLLADLRVGDEVPRRSGGIAMADLTAGMMTAISALAGLVDTSRGAGANRARGFEVSLLGAALSVQIQRFVALGGESGNGIHSALELDTAARRLQAEDDLEPYYRCYATADGFLALACLNLAQRAHVQALLDIDDPYAANPQQQPHDRAEREFRLGLRGRFATVIASRSTAAWVAALRGLGVPCGPVRNLDEMHRDPQVAANGLVQSLEQPGVGTVSLLGTPFKIDGVARARACAAPRLGAHTVEVMGESARLTAVEGRP